MANKTLYIPEQDRPLWDAAQRVADKKRISLYRLIANALESHLPTAAAEPSAHDRWATLAADQPAA